MAKLPIAILSFCIALLAGARRAQGAASASTCSNGFEGIDGKNQHGNVCCPLGCNQCGGPGCGSNGDPGFGNKECCPNGILANQGSCALTGAAPCFIVNHRTCSNGIVGIDGSNKSGDKVCCPIQCNQCGGPGCGVSGHVGFGNKECCPNGVVANQEDCAVTGTAPCVITEDSSLLPGMPGEAQTSVKEPLESGCQDHGGINRFYSDGYCDAVNNNKWCLWDGGDCCEESCRDGAEYLCVDNVFECVDPKFVTP